MRYYSQGFTLIELLGVVLISAQYERILVIISNRL
ncbi:prepilin-type N-terminal cleavage/methylation domain-containing protein [Pelagibacterales bacterium SAG-MED01]|nr:prepilin-type N-terminal cleavage/methylation domain-containing protein [Pelagibacterales bacterium SAG-MED01]